MSQILKLKRQHVYHTIFGIDVTKQKVKSSITVVINSRFNNFELTFLCLVVAKITNILPPKTIESGCITLAEFEVDAHRSNAHGKYTCY